MTSGIATAADRFVSFHNGDLLLNPGKTVAAYLDPNDCKGSSRISRVARTGTCPESFIIPEVELLV